MNQESRKAGKNLRDSQLTEQIIAAAIRVHRVLGPGFLESIYEEALAVEFALSGIQFVRQFPVPLFYRDHQIGEHRLDFMVESKIVVDLKATNLQDGLLFNFATVPLTIKRFCREKPSDEPPDFLK